MSQDIYTLKDSIIEVIRGRDYSFNDLKKMLNPLTKYIDAPNFKNNLSVVVEEIVKDRDGNNRFTLEDLNLIKDDLLSISSIVNGILLVLNSIPELKVEYDSGVTEELVFKVLTYIILVVIPKETGKVWKEEEKELVVDLILSIYQLILSSKIAKDLSNNILNWFKKKGLCRCLGGQVDKDAIFEEKAPQVKANIRSTVQKQRDTAELRAEIINLRKEVNDLKGGIAVENVKLDVATDVADENTGDIADEGVDEVEAL